MKIKYKAIYILYLLFAFNLSLLAASDWNAHWIWQEQDGPKNSWMAFRKEVQLDAIPKEVVARIAVDSKFWLWINGKPVLFEGSPSRGASPSEPWVRDAKQWLLPPERNPANTWYEEVDIQPYLKEGNNTIAVLVWFWGIQTSKGAHINSGKGAFLFQSQIGDQLVISDKTWKAIQHPAYDINSSIARTNQKKRRNRFIVPSNVKFDARQAMGDWTDKAWWSEGYSGKNWNAAVEKGKPPMAPWYDLEKNQVPHLVNHGLQYYVNYPAEKNV